MVTVTFLMQGTHHIADHEQDTCKSMKVGVSTHLCLSKERLEGTVQESQRGAHRQSGFQKARKTDSTVRKGAK